MKAPGAPPEVRSAILVASDPFAAVRRWRIFSGCKVVGCPSFFPIPEIFHAVDMLPVFPGPREKFQLLAPLMDEWIRLPDPLPKGFEEALDWVESVAGWAESVSGKACTNGALERSIRFYRERDLLAKRLEASGASNGFFDSATIRSVLNSGRFLPVETHTMLLSGILGHEPQDMPPETDHYDPLLFLARKAQKP